MEDVMVWIGEEECNVTSLSNTQLTCLPPEKQPKGSFGENPPTLIVSAFIAASSSRSTSSLPLLDVLIQSVPTFLDRF